MNADQIPALHPDEHALLEEIMHRSLSTLEAYTIILNPQLRGLFMAYCRLKEVTDRMDAEVVQ